jgi:hypothetical protein
VRTCEIMQFCLALGLLVGSGAGQPLYATQPQPDRSDFNMEGTSPRNTRRWRHSTISPPAQSQRRSPGQAQPSALS